MGQTFTWVAWVTSVIIFALVAWVKYIFPWVFACVKILCVGPKSLRGSFLSFFFVSLFPAILDQTLFDSVSIFEWLIRNL